LGARIKETNPKAFAEFYKRVLSDKSGVEVLALNELPLGCRGAQSPKVMWEIWCRDPDKVKPGFCCCSRGMNISRQSNGCA
jgi:hypothetical protein